MEKKFANLSDSVFQPGISNDLFYFVMNVVFSNILASKIYFDWVFTNSSLGKCVVVIYLNRKIEISIIWFLPSMEGFLDAIFPNEKTSLFISCNLFLGLSKILNIPVHTMHLSLNM